MSVHLGPDDLISGFTGTSRNVPAPPKIAEVAGQIAGLIGKWSEPVYKKHISCVRGGGLKLALELDEKIDEAVARYTITPSDPGACPIK